MRGGEEALLAQIIATVREGTTVWTLPGGSSARAVAAPAAGSKGLAALGLLIQVESDVLSSYASFQFSPHGGAGVCSWENCRKHDVLFQNCKQ
jgi:hypothetical protein